MICDVLSFSPGICPGGVGGNTKLLHGTEKGVKLRSYEQVCSRASLLSMIGSGEQLLVQELFSTSKIKIIIVESTSSIFSHALQDVFQCITNSMPL